MEACQFESLFFTYEIAIIVEFSIYRGNEPTVKNLRPKNLNLFTIRFPVPAIVSILHRISGVILFLLIPFLLWLLHRSLASEDSFYDLYERLSTPWVKFIVWGALSAFYFHFVAGIRHLLMDINIATTLKKSRLASFVTIIVSLILIILTGVWLW